MPAVKPLAQVTLDTSLTTIYTAPALGSCLAEIYVIWVCNITASAGTYSLRTGSGTLGAGNAIVDAKALAAHEFEVIQGAPVCLYLSSGQKLEGLADAGSKVVVTVYGGEILG